MLGNSPEDQSWGLVVVVPGRNDEKAVPIFILEAHVCLLIHQRVGLPSRGTLTAWRNELTETL